ncbi:MAG: DNA translocase FtsK [Rikenellaceae bacterium]
MKSTKSTPDNNEPITGEEESVQVPSENSTNIRWILGLLVILAGLYATLSAIQYFFHWKADLDLLLGVNQNHPDFETFKYGNRCGGFGAKIGHLLIGRSFGIAGVIIPIYLVLFGVNLIRGSRRLILNRDTLTMFIVLILSSLTLGAIFGESWNVFGSGLGGAFGISISQILNDVIGIGQILLLLGAWAAVGVFINSNFVNIVNHASSSALSSTESKLTSIIKRIKAPRKSDKKLPVEDEVVDEEPIENEQTINQLYGDESSQTDATQVDNIFNLDHPRANTPTEADVDEDNPFEEVIGRKVTALEPVEIVEQVKPELLPEPDPMTDFISEQPANDPSFEIFQPEPTDRVVGFEFEESRTNSSNEQQIELPSGGSVVFVEVNESKLVDENDLESSVYDPTKDIHNFIKPPITLLEEYQAGSDVEIDKAEIFENKTKIEETLNHFGIPIQQIRATVGPTITLYEIIQAHGVKISKIQGLENDIAQSLKALGIRIIAPIPGKGTIGIEVPNRTKKIVSMRSAVRSEAFQEVKAQLPIVIGRTIQNENYVFDLAKMPHLLVAGATGQGKSVGLNAIITSLLYRKHPSELKFVMIDPKMVEFTPYRDLEFHYMAKMESEDDVIITDPKKAVYALNAICEEMESRLKLLSQAGVRNIVEYNEKFKNRLLNPEKGHFFMPYIVVVIDEFADLIMTAKEVEMPVMRIAQKARAVGIHLIVATQRPDVKVITGGIKANFPARIAFKVTQMIDSRTIIDQPGANQLIGRGDMLFSKDGELTRIQCALVETDEVARIVEHISKQQGYSGAYRLPDYTPDGGGDLDMGSSDSGPSIKYDALFAEIARTAVTNGAISTSAIQRNFEVGFNRAGRIMTQLERAGIVGRQEGSKPRSILFYDLPSLEAKLQELGLF